MSCAERKLHDDPVEQERLNDQLAMRSGFKKCPECKVWIEKTEGCNHMACKCGAHICWVCMSVFTPNTIYGHLSATQGGFHREVNAGNQHAAQLVILQEVGGDEDQYAVQLEVVTQGRQLREQRQERLRREEQIRRWRMQLQIDDDLRWQTEIRCQEIRRQEEHHRQEQAQQNDGWGCSIM